MNTIALIRRIVRITNKLSYPNAILSKDELINYATQGLGDHDESITIRTLQRDFTAIQDIFGIRIGYNRARKGYCILERGETAHEYEKLLQNFELLSRIDDPSLVSCIDAEHRLPPIGDSLHEVLFAIRERRMIEIEYEHYRNCNEIRKHTISPHLLKESQHRWYIVGYNEGGELRVYALERVQSVKYLEHRKFKPRPMEKIKQQFSESFGVWADGNQQAEDVVIKYDRLDGSFVKSLPLHHTQRVIEENEDSITIGLKLRITNDFVMALLSRSRSIEIIKPHSLRQRMYETLLGAIERNKI